MGLFDFFFRPPTIEQFAKKFIKALRRAGVSEELTYDSAQQRIVKGSGELNASINLVNFYEEHKSRSWFKRRGHLNFLARVLTSVPEDLPTDFAEAKPHLRPKIWSRAGLEVSRLHALQMGGDSDCMEIPEYELGSHLVASLAYDLPNAVRSIGKSDLETWGVTYYEALECARENLESQGAMVGQIGDGCYVLGTGDTYDASRLLVPSLFEKFEVVGDLIAIIPNRDTLVVTGTEDEQGLQIMAQIASTPREPSRPLVPIPLRRDDDDWVDWFPPRNHRLYGRFKDLATEYFHGVYGDQKSALERLYEKEGKDVFVASYTAMQKSEADTVFSYAVWTQGIVSQLPVVDWIVFGLADGDDFKSAAIARWEDVQRVVGHLMRPTDFYPPRFEVSEFPTPAELEELGMEEMGP